jgi:hypothetical protein
MPSRAILDGRVVRFRPESGGKRRRQDGATREGGISADVVFGRCSPGQSIHRIAARIRSFTKRGVTLAIVSRTVWLSGDDRRFACPEFSICS